MERREASKVDVSVFVFDSLPLIYNQANAPNQKRGDGALALYINVKTHSATVPLEGSFFNRNGIVCVLRKACCWEQN